MSRTACTEPQCLYRRALPLLPLWAVRPAQSLSACTRVTFTFTFSTSNSKPIKKARYLLIIYTSGVLLCLWPWIISCWIIWKQLLTKIITTTLTNQTYRKWLKYLPRPQYLKSAHPVHLHKFHSCSVRQLTVSVFLPTVFNFRLVVLLYWKCEGRESATYIAATYIAACHTG
jgi:hypothetical protein